MSSEPPAPGAIPGWDQQPAGEPAAPAEPRPAAPAEPGWPPAPAAQPVWPSIPSTPPAPGTGAVPGWGQSPAPSPQSPAEGGGQPGWGAPATGGPGAAPPGAWNPQPATSSGSSGCLKLFLIVAAVGLVGVVLVVGVLVLFVNKAAESIGVNQDGSVGTACPFIEDNELSDALGSDAEALVLDGLWDATIGQVLDKRVLPAAEDCWITADESTGTGRIAVYRGGDAAAVFQQELLNAQPTSQDQGGGITLENPGYFAGAVSGLGDEAFCTDIDIALQGGVLTRKGETVVYVSLIGASTSAASNCEVAQEVARRILP